MSFVRADALATLTRYREALIGANIILFGLWWAWGSLGAIKWIGLTITAVGAAILWSGLRHARIRAGHGGVGVVQVDERQITYLAPVGGGFASLDDVGRIEIATDRAGLAVWRFRTGNEILFIPVRAEGAEALFDALTALPGANIDAAIRAANQPPNDTVVIWQRGVAKLH
ncbi:hypothetical protein GCM10016455_22130 [Aliiroseovarius zhejiangensis]|uniref:PH domain-containing protein n=1 Tax=Aliiroseovarius zhejiangensis TaxID=1632025 RepID=A0ABQ3J4W6_9RHOB|nr:hypothetical protein [Aliiroseovarius zhejiangensis]GHF00689.1 hypothetical protein GCM10016455_22130 [Aliiroseovarius zhejiangensis]